MGEEAAGIDAVRIALARIASGQSDIALVGGAHNGERKDLLMLYEFGDFNLKDKFAPVWSRADKGGFALGSGGVFLVIESKKHAAARGAKPYARLAHVGADRAQRGRPGAIAETLQSLWRDSRAQEGATAIITGATGAEPATAEERSFLQAHKNIPVRATGTRFGHIMEAQFPLGIALAALALAKGSLFPASDSSGFEIAMTAAPTQIVVVGTGHWRGEGMALVEAVK
jgi:3-oxoacyl-[acyl-carrier-protein] synthase II